MRIAAISQDIERPSLEDLKTKADSVAQEPLSAIGTSVTDECWGYGPWMYRRKFREAINRDIPKKK